MSESGTAHAGPVTDPWRLGGNGNISTDGTNFLGTTNPAPLIFKTTKGAGGPIERMRIGTSGNVGIGTTSPTGLMHAKTNNVAPAVVGENTSIGSGVGVRGLARFGTGVRGEGGIGLYGDGDQIGVLGSTDSSEEGVVGVFGALNSTTPGAESAAVYGRNNGTNGVGAGVRGFHASNGIGVHGVSRNMGVRAEGAYGVSAAGTAVGVSASASGAGAAAVIASVSGSLSPYAVLASARTTDGSTPYAGWFTPRVHVNGTLTKSAGSFTIDHPLDPENKYLSHSFVESPDMMNVYNGNVVLDENGSAEVILPDWFEALNRDFRYQLTPIGAFATIYIARKIDGNRFSIAGGEPGMEVSWQVTGIRQDAYANANPILVEEDKAGADRGKYLHPRAHGKPESAGVDAERIAELGARQPGPPGSDPHSADLRA